MEESQRSYVLTVTSSNSRLNPNAPRGAAGFRPRDIAYVVERKMKNGSQLWVVTSDKWLNGWEVNKRVRVIALTKALDVVVRGIMDFGTATREGNVPNVRLQHWRA